MTGLQTEPFTAPLEPFTAPAGVEEGSEDVRYEDVASEPSSATTLENGARKSPKNRQLTVYLPDDVHTRLVRQIERERRQMRVVMDKCVSDFLKDDAEPRPYLPAVFAGRMGQYTFRISADLKDELYRRAWIEGRSAVTLMQRAILDYLEANEEVTE